MQPTNRLDSLSSLITIASEVTPLLQSVKRIPWFQLSILLFLQLLEPLTSHVIYPFAPELIREIGITFGDESHVGYYVGLLQSLFYFAEAMTVLYWSRTSDRIGRKPVILIGLFGSSLSMLCFGLSKSFYGLVLSRCISGALNGNIGVIKSMMAEMVDPADLVRVYAFSPLAWSTGATLGPMIGGYLSRPSERFPDVFGQIEFLKSFPYFLPCIVPVLVTIVAWLVTFFFLKETVKSPLPVSSILQPPKSQEVLHLSGVVVSAISTKLPVNPDALLPLRGLLTPQVIIAVANYAALSFVDITFRAIQPLFLATPIALGGLGLPPSTIGNILAIYGTLNGCIQVLFFAQIHDYLGSKKTYMAGIASAIPLFLVFPIISLLAKTFGLVILLWIVLGVQIILPTAFSFAFGAIFMYITAASPNPESLGAMNGLSQMLASVMRGIGPGFANGLFSLTVEKNYLGGYLVYYVLMAVAAVATVVATSLPRKLWIQERVVP
ncbi:member of major facilitator superfamily multidrug-resistance, DHA1 sub-family [Lyophyllum atratum]|nr:member of major facilitator superfamily multidrug-resistance, DHA1 sub-family [Lyophyllum atratum]